MGTNYYLYQSKPCPTCGHRDEPLHIGKSSMGWCFALQTYPDRDINSLEDWIDLWGKPDARIEDEYGSEISPEDMLEKITNRKHALTWEKQREKAPYGYNSWERFHWDNESEEGPNGLLRHRIGRYCSKHGDGTYDLMVGEFS